MLHRAIDIYLAIAVYLYDSYSSAILDKFTDIRYSEMTYDGTRGTIDNASCLMPNIK